MSTSDLLCIILLGATVLWCGSMLLLNLIDDITYKRRSKKKRLADKEKYLVEANQRYIDALEKKLEIGEHSEKYYARLDDPEKLMDYYLDRDCEPVGIPRYAMHLNTRYMIAKYGLDYLDKPGAVYITND